MIASNNKKYCHKMKTCAIKSIIYTKNRDLPSCICQIFFNIEINILDILITVYASLIQMNSIKTQNENFYVVLC